MQPMKMMLLMIFTQELLNFIKSLKNNKKMNYGLLENLMEDIMYLLSHTKFMSKMQKEDFKFHLKDVLLEMDG